MNDFGVEEILIVICSIVVLSYVFTIVSKYIRVPSVLLLMFAGIGFRAIADAYGFEIEFPARLIESLGVVGLIMIILEAGLDLKLGRDKSKMIRESFFAALFIFAVSVVLITWILNILLNAPIEKCLIYSIPLSIMSSSIVIPSIHPLTQRKKEFSIYEASFSDILGILVFNYFIADNVLTWASLGIFAGNIIVSIVLSLLLSFVLFLILAKTRMNIKFFLIFALLTLIYAGGKIFNLPSLLIILIFGLMINNWEKIRWPKLLKHFPEKEVEPLRDLLHSITAETSFLVRTFFFILFGFGISLDFLGSMEVIIAGSCIVAALFLVRLLYLRFFLKTYLFPEVFFIPRGLITIVLFYKIPEQFKLGSFDYGILFFIILATSIIMAIGMILYKKKPEQVIEEGQFEERRDIM